MTFVNWASRNLNFKPNPIAQNPKLEKSYHMSCRLLMKYWTDGTKPAGFGEFMSSCLPKQLDVSLIITAGP